MLSQQIGLAALYHYATFVGSAIVLGLAFLSMAVALSVMAADRVRASGIAIALWFFYVLVYDLLLLALLVVTEGQFNVAFFPVLLLLSPADVFRILNLLGLDDLRQLYGWQRSFRRRWRTLVVGRRDAGVDRRAARTGDLEVQMIEDPSRRALMCAGLAVALLAACREAAKAVQPQDFTRSTTCALDGMVLADYPGPKGQIQYDAGPPDFYCDTVEMLATLLRPEQQSASPRSTRRTWRRPTGPSRGVTGSMRGPRSTSRQQAARFDGPDARVLRQRGGRAGVRRQERRQGAALRPDHDRHGFARRRRDPRRAWFGRQTMNTRRKLLVAMAGAGGLAALALCGRIAATGPDGLVACAVGARALGANVEIVAFTGRATPWSAR